MLLCVCCALLAWGVAHGARTCVACAASVVRRVGAVVAFGFLRCSGMAVDGAVGVAAGCVVIVGMCVTQTLACIRLAAVDTAAAPFAQPRRPGGAAALRRHACHAVGWDMRALLTGMNFARREEPEADRPTAMALSCAFERFRTSLLANAVGRSY